MVKYSKKRIKRMIERERKRMQPLIDNFADLSKWGGFVDNWLLSRSNEHIGRLIV